MWKKNKIYYKKKINILNLIKNSFIFISLYIILFLNIQKNIKIALCTMGKKENLYVKEFINYYLKLGIDKIFIFDDNDENTEKISDMIDFKFKKYVKIYKSKKLKILRQSQQFTFCYKKNKNKFNWILMRYG